MVSRRTILAALSAWCAAAARPAAGQFIPDQTGAMDGKDVMWVPTPDAAVARMLDMARVGPGDVVVDLGSGDGRIAIAAGKRGARARGIEYSADLVLTSREQARAQGVADRVTFREADLFEVDFSDATVITLYLLTTLNVKLRPRILALKPGTRVVSHMFRMGDWEPDERDRVGASEVFFWIVPARVAGNWRLTQGADTYMLELQQSHQRVTGGVRFARGGVGPIEFALRGAEVRCAFDDASGRRRALSGRVDGDVMQGEGWRAVRVSG
jgi:SAM-dependent methyltransferase